jgi:PAS domain S-box-containing protein
MPDRMQAAARAAPRLDSSFLSRIAEDASVGIAVIAAPVWRFVYANPAFRKLAAMETDLIGWTVADVFPPRHDDTDNPFGDLLNAGRTLSHRAIPVRRHCGIAAGWWEFDLIPLGDSGPSSGRIMIIGRAVTDGGPVRRTAGTAKSAEATAVRDPTGRATHGVRNDVDIAACKETDAEPRRSEALLRATLDCAPVGLGIVDRELRFLHVNSRLAAISGVSAHDHVGRGLRDGLGPVGEILEPLYHEALLTGAPVEDVPISGTLRAAPDQPRNWVASCRPLRDDTGEVTAVSAVVMEVTELHEARQGTADAQHLLQSVIDGITDSVTIRGLDGRYMFANQAATVRLGQPLEHILNRTPAQILSTDIVTHIDAQLRQVTATGKPVSVEETVEVAGEPRIYHTIRSPWRDADGVLRGVITVARDITERKQAERLLADTNAELKRRVAERTRALAEAAEDLKEEIGRREEAQTALAQARKLEALGQLTSGVAHDFNNVLAAISGSLELLRRGVRSERELRLLENGRSAVDRAAGLVRHLMSFARRQKLEPQVISLHAMLPGTRELLVHSLTRRITCDIVCAPGTWPVMADPHQLEVALINLAVNARDAMPAGGTLRIETRNLTVTEQEAPNPTTGQRLAAGQYVSIAVRDSGIGMSPEVLGRVLEPFFTTKGPDQGTGLGLAMVYGFATQSGGTVRIDSREGIGTTVELILPRAAMGLPEAADAVDELRPELHGNAELLVVDDDPRVRTVTAGLLRDLGYGVTEAASAEAAFALATTMKRLDLIITDLVMPRAGGLVLAQRLREEKPMLPILFVTGQASAPSLQGETVIAKPFTQRELAAGVLRKLRRVVASAENPTVSDPLVSHIRTEALRGIYLAWQRARNRGAVPNLRDLDLNGFGLADWTFVADVRNCEDATAFRYLSVGSRLTIRLGRSLDGQTGRTDNARDASDAVLGSLTGAYLRCCRTKAPTYQFARYDLGDGAPTLFERLLLPISDDGEQVTQLAGVVLISDPPEADAGAQE